jgi:N-methylhydantoinase B
VAYAEHSGSVLAVAPHHWTDGCPILQWRSSPDGPDIRHRAYLDPATGRMLHVEVVPAEGARNFSVMPARWAGANP